MRQELSCLFRASDENFLNFWMFFRFDGKDIEGGLNYILIGCKPKVCDQNCEHSSQYLQLYLPPWKDIISKHPHNSILTASFIIFHQISRQLIPVQIRVRTTFQRRTKIIRSLEILNHQNETD